MLTAQANMAMNNLEKPFSWIAAALLFLIAVAIPFDIVGFYNEKEMYASVHQLDKNQPNWEWQYLQRDVFLIIFSLIGLTIITLRLIKHDNRILKIINRSFLVFFFFSVILSYYNWMKTGYDH